MSEGSPKEGRSPGEGPEYLPDGTPNLSGIARQERADKAAAANGPASSHAKEKRAEAERIARDEARYRGGMPVAGHGERDEGRGRGRSR